MRSGPISLPSARPARPAEANEELWGTQWEQWGSCADFNTEADYFSFMLNAAQQYDANVRAAGAPGLLREETVLAAALLEYKTWLP